MKKTNVLLTIPLLFGFVSCSSNNEVSIQDKIINSILEGVNIKVEGIESITYPDNYSYLSKKTPISIDRDYKKIKEKDGSLTPAVRVNTDYDFSTYIKNKEGYAYSEYLLFNNEVYEEILKISGNKIIYNERFSNPFEYVDSSDIDNDFSLDLVKATFVVESLTGLQYQVKEAKFNVENNVASSLDLVMFDRIDIVETSETEEIFLTSKLELNINFTYGINEITHLSPRSLNDKIIKNAFSSLTNYTLIASIEEQNPITVYVTEKDILFHYGKDEALNDNDKYYKNVSPGVYDEYTYSFANGEFVLSDFEIKEDEFLPIFRKFSSDVLIKDSKNVYYFDAISSRYGLEKLVLPEFKVNGDYGISGSIILKNDSIDTITSKFYPTSPYTITQKFINQGTTSLPDWFDESLVK